LGLWWAEPAAALIMVPIIAREGFEDCAVEPATKRADNETQ